MNPSRKRSGMEIKMANTVTEYREEDFLMLSGIQHFAFCRRQWALIHIEQQWEENVRTFEGRMMHDNAHNPDFHENGNQF